MGDYSHQIVLKLHVHVQEGLKKQNSSAAVVCFPNLEEVILFWRSRRAENQSKVLY